jgi:hypothetical protein
MTALLAVPATYGVTAAVPLPGIEPPQAWADDLQVLPDIFVLDPLGDPPQPPQSASDIVWERMVQKPGYDLAYTASRSSQYNGVATPNHIVARPDHTVNFYGYGQDERTDYSFADSYADVRHFEFKLRPSSLNFHTFAQCATLFNGGFPDPSNQNLYTGYAIVLNNVGEGSTASLGLYKGTWDIRGKIPTKLRVATYRTGIRDGAHGSSAPIDVSIDIDVDQPNRPFRITVDGALKTEADSAYGDSHGLGFVASYYGHYCSVLTVLTLEDFVMHSEPAVWADFPENSVTVNFLMGDDPIAAPQAYTGKEVYQTFSVDNGNALGGIPEKINYEGVTYSLLTADPPDLLKKSGNNWTYTGNIPKGGGTINLRYDAVAVNKEAALDGDKPSSGSSDAPVLVKNGDIINYVIQPSNAGTPIGDIPLIPAAPAANNFVGGWRQKNATTGGASGGSYWAYYTYRQDVGSSKPGDPNYTIEVTYHMPKGVYENITIPIGHYMGNNPSASSHNGRWDEDYGSHSMTATLRVGDATGPVAWSGTFSGNTYGAVNGSVHAPGMLSGQNGLNYSSMGVNFGKVVVSDAGAVTLVLQSTRWRDARHSQGGHFEMSYGFVVGTLSGLQKSIVDDTLPAGLTYVPGSGRVVDPTGTNPDTTTGINVSGQSVMWEVPAIQPVDSPCLAFDAVVTAPDGVYALFANSASLRIATGAAPTTIDGNTTYHAIPGPVTVTERFVDALLDTPIQPDRANGGLVNGTTWAATPAGTIAEQDTIEQVAPYAFAGYRWDADAAVPAGTVGVADPVSRVLDLKDHMVSYLYNDARGYPEVGESYYLFDGAANSTLLPGAPATSTKLTYGADYLLPVSKTGAKASGASSYSYYGYSVDGGATIARGSDKQPTDPLFTHVTSDMPNAVRLYFAKNPVYTVSFGECNVSGSAVTDTLNRATETSQATYGDPLNFNDALTRGTGSFRYYGYSIGGEPTIHAGAPQRQLSPALTSDYSIKLWFAQAHQVTVRYKEAGNDFNSLQSSTLFTVGNGDTVSAASLAALCAAPIDVQESADSTRAYTYANAYQWSGGSVSNGTPGGVQVVADMTLTLYFSASYQVTLQYHENRAPTDDSGGSDAAAVLKPDTSVAAAGGSVASLTAPPATLRYHNHVWSYEGYKLGTDHSEATPDAASNPVTGDVLGPLWTDQTHIYVYGFDPNDASSQLYTAFVAAEQVDVPSVGLRDGGTPSASSLNGAALGDGNVGNVLPGEQVVLSTTENPGFAFDHWTFADKDGNVIDPHDLDLLPVGATSSRFVMPAFDVTATAHYLSTNNRPTLQVRLDGTNWPAPSLVDGSARSYQLVGINGSINTYSATFVADGYYKFPQMADGTYELYDGSDATGATVQLGGESPLLPLDYYTFTLSLTTENHYPAGYSGPVALGGQVNLPASGIYRAGAMVPIEADADADFDFTGWTLSGNAGATVSDPTAENPSVTMPASGTGGVTATAGFERKGVAVTTGQVLLDAHGNPLAGTGGTFTPGGTFYLGLVNALTATPGDGVAFVGWQVTSGAGTLVHAASTSSAGFTPTDPDNPVELTAVFQVAATVDVSLDVANTVPLDGLANRIRVSAANHFPNPVSISGLEWLRVPLNGAATSLDFTAASQAAAASDKGTLAASDFDGFAGTGSLRSAELPADENGRYWLRIGFRGYSNDGSEQAYTVVTSIDVSNIYTPYAIYQRDYNNSFSRIITAYRQLPSNQGALPTAVPYDLHGSSTGTVLAVPGAGWRSVTFSPDKPGYRYVYYIALPESSPWSSTADNLVVTLDGSFFTAFAPHADSGVATGHYYTVGYTMDPSRWHDANAYYVKADGSAVTVPSGGSTNAVIKVCADDSSTPFNELGGIYIPPEESPFVPVGWYIDENASSRAPGTAGAPGGSTYAQLTDFTQLDADFTDLIQSIADHADNAANPLLGLYVVYEERYRVTEHHYLYDPGQGGPTAIKLAEDTGTVLVAGSPYSKQPLALSGLVAVGATSSDTATYSGAVVAGPLVGNGLPKLPYSGAGDSSQQQFFTVSYGAVNADSSVSFYYEACTSGTQPGDRPGIPLSEVLAITTCWKELPATPGAATVTVKAPEVTLTRNTTAHTVTNDGTPSGSATHSVAAGGGAAWLFDSNGGANPQAQAVNDPPSNIAAAEVTFYYLFATNGAVPDRDQWVLRHYAGMDTSNDPATPLELKPPNLSIALTSQAYTETAPAFPGWIYSGLVHGTYPGGAPALDSTSPTLTLDPAVRGATPKDTWTFLYEPGGYYSASADGAPDMRTTATLTLEFDSPIVALDAADITVTGTGAAPGAATVVGVSSSNGGRTWTATVSDVQQGGALVQVTRAGSRFVGLSGPQEVTLSTGPGLVSASFDGVADSTTSRLLTLTFSKPVSGLNYLMGASATLTGTGAQQGSATLAHLSAAYPEPFAAVPNTVWYVYVTNVQSQGSVSVTVSVPAAAYTLSPDTQSATVQLEKRYLVYHKGSAPYVTGFPPFAQDPDSAFGLVFTGDFTQTVVAGQMDRTNYVLFAWNTQPDLRGEVYYVGDAITLDTPWTQRAEDSPNGIPTGCTQLWPMWLAAPQPHLYSPFVNSDGSVTFTGRVLRVTNDYRVSLEFRKLGTTSWTTVFDTSHYGVISDDVWSFFDAGSPAQPWTVSKNLFSPGEVYEVRLFAIDAVVWNNIPSATDTVLFRTPLAPPPGGSGSIDIRFDNLDVVAHAVVVTLQEGDEVIAPPKFFNPVEAGGHRELTFANVGDGYYNVVVDYGAYRTTRGVRVAGGRSYEVISGEEIGVNGRLLRLALGRLQSVVTIRPGAPLASVDGLPELFDVPSVFDPVADQSVITLGGTVELRLDVGYLGQPDDASNTIPPPDLASIVATAEADGREAVEFYDFRLFKASYDLNGIALFDPVMIASTGERLVVVSYPLPESAPADRLAAVYRVHGGSVQALAKTPNADGEYFEVRDGFILLHVGRFSTYALVLDPVDRDIDPPPGPGENPGGEDPGGNGPGSGGSSSPGGGGPGGGGHLVFTGDQSGVLLLVALSCGAAGLLFALAFVVRRRVMRRRVMRRHWNRHLLS